MSVLNRTPFPDIAFRQYNLAGDLLGVVSVRGTFKLVENGPLALAAEQEPLELADLYGGDPHETDLLRQGCSSQSFRRFTGRIKTIVR